MKRLSQIWKYGKAIVVPVAAAAVPLAAGGQFGPKAQAVAAALIALYGVFLRPPKTVGPEPVADQEKQ